MIAYAQASAVAWTYVDKINQVILYPLIALISAVALVFFIWGGVQLVLAKSDNDTARQDGKKHMIWGIVGLLVMVSAYGLLEIVVSTLGADLPTQ